MQVNHNSRFVKNLMIGLLASGVGSLVALPSVAMPTATTVAPITTEASEATAVEVVPKPTATEMLPLAEPLTDPLADPLAEPLAEPSVGELETAPVAEDDMTETAPVAEDGMIETAPVAEDGMIETAPVAEDGMIETAPVAEDDMTETAPVAEDGMTEPVPVTEDAVDTSEFTITELTSSSASFKTLTAALAAAGLTEMLSGEGPYTIFAPTDEAFAALPEGAIEQLLLPENKDVLVRILTYHVVPGAVRSSDLKTGSVETLEGSDVAVEAGDTVTVNNANVIVPDVEASNGVIHIVDRVILPPAPEASTGAEPSAAAPVQ